MGTVANMAGTVILEESAPIVKRTLGMAIVYHQGQNFQ
jgi:hypothetical protein